MVVVGVSVSCVGTSVRCAFSSNTMWTTAYLKTPREFRQELTILLSILNIVRVCACMLVCCIGVPFHYKSGEATPYDHKYD